MKWLERLAYPSITCQFDLSPGAVNYVRHSGYRLRTEPGHPFVLEPTFMTRMARWLLARLT